MDWRLALIYWLMSMFHEGRGCSLHSRTTISLAIVLLPEAVREAVS